MAARSAKPALGRARSIGGRARMAAAAALSACIQNDGSRNPLANLGKVTVDDEREVGAQARRARCRRSCP